MLLESNFNSAVHACAHRVTYGCKMLYGHFMASSKLSSSAPLPQPNLPSSCGPLLVCLQAVDSLKRNVARSGEIRGRPYSLVCLVDPTRTENLSVRFARRPARLGSILHPMN